MNAPTLATAVVRMEKTALIPVTGASDVEGPKYTVRPINLYVRFYSHHADWSDYGFSWSVEGRQILKSGSLGKVAKYLYRWEYEQLPTGVPQWITDAVERHRPVQS
jgi:hypothetical protein